MKALALALLLVGCTHEVIKYQSVPLPVPAKPELPIVMRSELTCLADDVYSRLIYRELLLKRHAEVQTAVICSTHPQKSPDCLP